MPDYQTTGHGPAGLDPRTEAADAIDAAVEARQAELIDIAMRGTREGVEVRDRISQVLDEQSLILTLCQAARSEDDEVVRSRVAASHIADAAWRLAERELGARPMSLDELRRREGGA